MTYRDDQIGIETSMPREAVEFELPSVTHRVAFGTRTVTIEGKKYTACPSTRDEIGLATSENQEDLVIRMPMKHAVCQRWLSLGSPPKKLVARVYRLQVTSNEYEKMWEGYVTSLGATEENSVALLRVPSRVSAILDKRLPNVTIGRSCPHVLYDRNCRVDRAGFTQNATIVDIQGRVVKVSTMGAHPDDWATFGELLHTTSTERMTVQSQIGTTITMQAAIPEMRLGDAVQIFAGCPHDITSCNVIFANRQNFGGIPMLNSDSPQVPTGFGISVQA